jgi:hypothetical protein
MFSAVDVLVAELGPLRLAATIVSKLTHVAGGVLASPPLPALLILDFQVAVVPGVLMTTPRTGVDVQTDCPNAADRTRTAVHDPIRASEAIKPDRVFVKANERTRLRYTNGYGAFRNRRCGSKGYGTDQETLYKSSRLVHSQ